nr:hypothetical protein [uncultured Draconibacterium sp.]
MNEKYKLQLTDWTKIPVKTAETLLNESQELVDYTISLSEKITQRAYTYSVIVIAAISGLITKLLTFKRTVIFDDYLFVLISISIIALFFIAFYISRLVFPFTLMQKGRRPQNIGKQIYLAPEKLSPENSYLNFLLSEIEHNQRKINFNEKINHQRLQKLKNLIYLLIFSFPAFVILYFFIFILCQ